MKIDRPYDQFLEIFRTSNRESRELLKYVFEKSDNISLWIIGLSIGGISIFANNIADIQTVISPCFLRPILLLLSISVTCGIMYRGLFLYYFVLLDNTLRGINIALSDQKPISIDSHLNCKESFKELVEKLNDRFGEDLLYLIPAFDRIDKSAKDELYKSIFDHYLNNVQTDLDNAVDLVAETYSESFGKSKDKILKKLNSPNTGSLLKWTLRLTTAFYFIYIITFIASLFTFVYAT